jgi:hypothetical protein
MAGLAGAGGLGKIIDSKIIFATTAERRETILNHNRARGQVRERATEGWPEGRGNGNDRFKWLGYTRMDGESQGYAWASQAGAVFSNPFASELARDCETSSLILLRKWPCAFASLRDFLEQTGLSLASKQGCVVKKHPQVVLRVSFPQQVQHSLHESILCFLVFPSV